MTRPVSYQLSKHARVELRKRNISVETLEAVLEAPDQIVEGHAGRNVYQSRMLFEGTAFLVRVIVAEEKTPPLVVTVYRTSKIQKYWSKP